MVLLYSARHGNIHYVINVAGRRAGCRAESLSQLLRTGARDKPAGVLCIKPWLATNAALASQGLPGDALHSSHLPSRFVMTEGVVPRLGADIFERLEQGPVEVVAAQRRSGPVRLTVTKEVRELVVTKLARG